MLTLRKTRVLTQYKKRFEKALDRFLPNKNDAPARLHQAMRYAALAGGKRIRPLLVYATGDLLGANLLCLDQLACAVECVHIYSLIHDDLPAMDNDVMRHHQPSCHVAFDEATAILAGNALQCLAFKTMSQIDDQDLSPWVRLEAINTLSQACGSHGIAGGQCLDIASVGQTLSHSALDTMHQMKTASLIQAAVKIGALAANLEETGFINKLEDFAQHLGLAFQIQDDILDVTQSTATLGKPAHSDTAQNKPTYPSVLGLDSAKTQMQQHYQAAMTLLSDLPFDTSYLAQLTQSLADRTH